MGPAGPTWTSAKVYVPSVCLMRVSSFSIARRDAQHLWSWRILRKGMDRILLGPLSSRSRWHASSSRFIFIFLFFSMAVQFLLLQWNVKWVLTEFLGTHHMAYGYNCLSWWSKRCWCNIHTVVASRLPHIFGIEHDQVNFLRFKCFIGRIYTSESEFCQILPKTFIQEVPKIGVKKKQCQLLRTTKKKSDIFLSSYKNV